jgi:hypothetical protein
MSFIKFLALNDAESSGTLWQPLLGLISYPGKGIFSLGGFIKFMGIFSVIVIMTLVALFKHEEGVPSALSRMVGAVSEALLSFDYSKNDDDIHELDASEVGWERHIIICGLFVNFPQSSGSL